MLTKEIYLTRARAVCRALDRSVDMTDEAVLRTFTFLSANIQHFLPMLAYGQHMPLFQRYRYAQGLNGLDVACFAGRYPLQVEGWKTFRRQIADQHGLICTYHFGAYQLVNYLLIKSEIPYTLLVAGHVKHTWQNRYPGLLQALEAAEKAGRFVLLDANDRSALRQLYRLSTEGFYTLIYVDGFEGINNKDRHTLQPVSLLGQQIAVPWGAAQLSHALGLPIYPLLALRHERKIQIRSDTTILPQGVENRNTYARMVMERLYGWLSPFLLHWPEQWANWTYLHHLYGSDLPIRGKLWSAISAESHLDQDAFGIYRLAGQSYLLRKRDMQVFPLEDTDYQTLLQDWYGNL